MTKKKKILLIVSVSVIAIGIFAGLFAMSSVACSFGPGPGYSRFHHRSMPPFVREEIGKFVLWRLDQGAKALDLNTTQQTAYDQLRASLSESIETGMQKREAFKQLAHSQLENETVDITGLTRSAMTHMEDFSAMVKRNLSLFDTFYATLDAKQQEMVNQKIKEKMQQHHDRYGSNER